MKLFLTAGIFSSRGSSTSAAALCLAQGGSILDANTLVPVGVLCGCLALIGALAYRFGREAQKIKGLMKRVEDLEKKSKR